MRFKKSLFASIAALSLCFFLGSCVDPDLISDIQDNLDDLKNPTTGGKSQYYLGYGYDVVNSSYMNRSDVKVSHPILDQQKLIKAGMVASQQVNVQDFQVSVGRSISTFYKDRNAGLNIKYANDVVGALFSGKFSFEFSYKLNESRIDSSSFLRGRSYVYTHDDYIKNATAQNMLEYLTESFAVDLQTKTASQLLDQYGTHAVVRYYKGGALEFNYVYNGSVLTKDTDLKMALNASFAGISGDASYSSSGNSRELEEKSTFHYYTYGGAAFDAFTLAELKGTYNAWLSSIPTNADICGIGNFDQSFIPIWALAEASGDTSKALALENEFNARAIRQGKALLVRRIKTVTYEKNTSGSATYTFNEAEKDSPAEIEIYVLGAGGGGQGGHNKDGTSIPLLGSPSYTGTGGAGGGGAAAYMKLVVEEPVSLSITVGKGGSGGSYADVGIGSDGRSGYKGDNGGATSVNWGAKSLTLSAAGGLGGSGNGTETNGGNGGGTSSLPNASSFYMEGTTAAGGKGSGGSKESDVQTTGGNAATIKIGSVNPFGGGSGGVRQKGGNTQAAQNGGGGSGGYALNSGKAGGDGHVIIKIRYYGTEESDLYKKVALTR